MKVIYVASDNNAASGAFICMVRLVHEIKNRGVDVKVILPKEGDGTKLLVDAGVPFVTIKSYSWDTPIDSDLYYLAKIPVKKFLNIFAIHLIKRYLRAERPDLVHINTSYSYVAAVAAYDLKIPVVWHIREFLEEDQNNRMWNREKGYALMSAADAIITISQAIYDKYKSILPEKKVSWVYDGVDTGKFYCPEKEIMLDDEIKMVCVGGLYPKKGQALLIEALGRYIEEHQMDICDSVNDKKRIYNQNNGHGKPGIRLKIVGRGPEEERLKALVSDLKLSEYVTFEGFSSCPEKYYRESDISFMTSTAEAFGLVTVEAMLSGALVIGADSAGTREIISDKETGLLYKTGDIDDFVSVIDYAIRHRAEMKRIAADGRLMALETFTAQRNADGVLMIYDEVLKSKTDRR